MSAELKANNAIAIVDAAIPEEAKFFEWPPIATNVELEPLPEFPMQALPPVMRDLVAEISQSVKVPESLAAAEMLGMVGLAIGRNVYYYFKKSLTGRANLYMLIFAARGERKSSVDSILQGPFSDWLYEKLKEYRKEGESFELLEKRREFLMNQIIKKGIGAAGTDNMMAEMNEINATLENTPPNPNIFTNNITQEALLQKLAECGGTVAMFSDDGRGELKMILGLRYSNDGDAHDEVLLDCYDGTKTVSYDRSGRSITPIKRPCVGLVLLSQPDMLLLLGDKAEVFDSGFASRCLYCFPETWVGKRNPDGSLKRDIDDSEISDVTMERYKQLIFRLMNRSSKQTEPVYIGLSAEAKEFWKNHYREIESESGEGGLYYDTLAIAIRYPSQTLRFALLISQVLEHRTIELEDIQNAHALMEYFIANAERCHSFIKKMALPNDAMKLVNYFIRNYKVCQHSIRDLYRGAGMSKSRFNQMIALLESRNYCRVISSSRSQKVGRQESDLVEANPEVLMLARQEN